MPLQPNTTPSKTSATLAGFALMLVVLAMQCVSLLANAASFFFGSTPVWLTECLRVLFPCLAFFLPALFIYKAARPLGLRVKAGKSRIPFHVALTWFLAAMLVFNALTGLVQNLMAPAAAPNALPKTALGWCFYVFATCILTPFCEELFFRGALQGLLRFWGRRFAMVVGSVVFALLHMGTWQLPTVFLLGLMLSYLAEAGGSIGPCSILHALNNALAILFALIPPEAANSWQLLAIIATVSAILCVIGFVGARKIPAAVRHIPKATPGGRSHSGKAIFKIPAFIAGMALIIIQFIAKLFH